MDAVDSWASLVRWVSRGMAWALRLVVDATLNRAPTYGGRHGGQQLAVQPREAEHVGFGIAADGKAALVDEPVVKRAQR